MKLTSENYHSLEAKQLYSGSTEIKQFMECEFKAMQEIKGLHKESKTAFLQGNYIDAHFDKTLDVFKAKTPELFTVKKDKLLSKYENITVAIDAVESDPVMNDLWTGKTQQIFTGEIEGLPIKIMVDSLHPDKAVDRKYMMNLEDKWSDKHSAKVAWWKVYGYEYQGAIYNDILKQNGLDIPFDLVPITKEDTPDKTWIRFSNQTLELALDQIKAIAPRIQALRTGLLEPTKCGKCACCRADKKLTGPLEV